MRRIRRSVVYWWGRSPSCGFSGSRPEVWCLHEAGRDLGERIVGYQGRATATPQCDIEKGLSFRGRVVRGPFIVDSYPAHRLGTRLDHAGLAVLVLLSRNTARRVTDEVDLESVLEGDHRLVIDQHQHRVGDCQLVRIGRLEGATRCVAGHRLSLLFVARLNERARECPPGDGP